MLAMQSPALCSKEHVFGSPKKYPLSSMCLSLVTVCSHTCDLTVGCASGPPVEVLLHSYPDPRWGGREGPRRSGSHP